MCVCVYIHIFFPHSSINGHLGCFHISAAVNDASLNVARVVKNIPTSVGEVGDTDSIPGLEDPLEEGMATHSGILAWRIHGQRNLSGYSP